MFDLTGKVALVTGARRGMGRAHAEALARQGATVIVTDIDDAECQAVAAGIRDAGGRATCQTLDVSSVAGIQTAVAALIEAHGSIDILINNAGIYTPKAALELSEAQWDTTLDINLKGQFFLAQAVAKHMLAKGWGRIINIASIASGQVGVGLVAGAHYAASKGGVIAMTESLALELATQGITVNVIAPGAIDTPMVHEGGMTAEEMETFLKTSVPMGRIGTPEEVAALAVFLASDESSYVTGATFVVDGGWLAQ